MSTSFLCAFTAHDDAAIEWDGFQLDGKARAIFVRPRSADAGPSGVVAFAMDGELRFVFGFRVGHFLVSLISDRLIAA